MSNIQKSGSKKPKRITPTEAAKAAEDAGFIGISVNKLVGGKILGRYIAEDSGAVAIGRSYMLFTAEQAKKTAVKCDEFIEDEQVPLEIKKDIISSQKSILECIVKAATGLVESAKIEHQKQDNAPKVLPAFGPLIGQPTQTNLQVNINGAKVTCVEEPENETEQPNPAP